MSAIGDAATELAAVLRSVPGLRVFKLGESVSPPCAVVGVPRLLWEAYSRDVTTAEFPVYLVAALDDRAVETLTTFAPLVATALEELTGASTDTAEPGLYPVGDLPAYLFTAPFPLT